jgi:hypothetical protein
MMSANMYTLPECTHLLNMLPAILHIPLVLVFVYYMSIAAELMIALKLTYCIDTKLIFTFTVTYSTYQKMFQIKM